MTLLGKNLKNKNKKHRKNKSNSKPTGCFAVFFFIYLKNITWEASTFPLVFSESGESLISTAIVFFSLNTYKYCPISNSRAVKFHFPSQKINQRLE